MSAVSWPEVYLDAIHAGDEVVSAKVREVYEREVEFIRNPPKDFPYYFDPERGSHHIGFMEKFCKLSKGDKGSSAKKLIRFELFQKAKLQLVFGWVEKGTNLRRFREVDDYRGRKCGKSTETAAVEWDVALNDGEYGAEIYCVANKRDQAMQIFNECVNMRKQSNALAAVSSKRQSDIYIEAFMSHIKALASNTSTMDGLNTHFFALDEFHEAKNRKIYDVMIQSQSARSQPLAWLISTNGTVRDGFFDTQYEYDSNVAMWLPGCQDLKILPLIYELDKREEWEAPECWAKANPGLGKIKKYTVLHDFVRRAHVDPTFLPTVLTKDFNIAENSAESWLSLETITNKTVVDMDFLRNSYAVGGCDLSSTTDLTCATLLIRKPGDSRFFVLQKYFLPQHRIKQGEVSDKREAPYRKWAEDGWLSVCEGATVDFHAVTEWFVMMVREFNIRPLYIGYDAALSGYWREEMESYGFNMERIRQGPFTWTYPMKELGGMFQEKRIVYNNNPMLRWCLSNTAKKTMNKDGIESIQPVKVSTVRRIDGMVSLLNAYTCFKNNEEDYLSLIK
ncbi:MAG: terminase large subunit [Firmicutes bacterium]|nr:terminase large subunit [Bacillota bacterium]